MDIEEEIARTLDKHSHSYDSDCSMDFGCTCGVIDDYDNSTTTHGQHLAAALMPLFRRAQAEAGAKALRDAVQEGPKKYYKRDLYGHSGAAIPVEWLDECADRIEQEAGA